MLNPYSVRIGRNGTSVTRLYWSGRMHDEAKGSSPDSATQLYRHQRYVHPQLVWQNPPPATLPPNPIPPSETKAIAPVSYTHLDVYKRQDLAIAAANGTETFGRNAEKRKCEPEKEVDVRREALESKL